jgi:hypothetical protein
MSATAAKLFGGSPGDSWRDRGQVALVRAMRTLIQGLAAAFPAAGPGSAVLSTTYWETFGYSCLAAAVTALVSFLNNIAALFPEDPTQRKPPKDGGAD